MPHCEQMRSQKETVQLKIQTYNYFPNIALVLHLVSLITLGKDYQLSLKITEALILTFCR